MWGNATGWFLAMVLLGSLIYGMHQLNDFGLISDPTSFGKDEANLAAVALPIPPSQLVAMNSPANAKALYTEAIADYNANRIDYDRLASSRSVSAADKLTGLKNLLAATHTFETAIFADEPASIVTYGDKPGLEALTTLGHRAARVALLKQADDPAEAVKYFEAEFSLGARLYDERLTVEEFSRGLELMSEASGGLIRSLPKANQADRAEEFHKFDESRKQYYNQRVLPMLKVLQSIDANVIGQHAGDIFYIANVSKERMYRVEAIFAMGRMRYFVGENGRIGNQRGATHELKRLSQNSDPIIQLAATQARDLTVEEYRMLK